MAVAGYHSPFMASVTAASTAPTLSLFDQLRLVYSDMPTACTYLAIQLDPSAGGTALYIGNSNVSSTMCGSSIVATQAPFVIAGDNLIGLRDIYLRTSTGEAQVNVIALVR